jgi:class 3 adenylate cyclase
VCALFCSYIIPIIITHFARPFAMQRPQRLHFTIFQKQLTAFVAVLALAAAIVFVALRSFSIVQTLLADVFSSSVDIKNHALMAESALRKATMLEKKFLIDLNEATAREFKQAIDESQSHVQIIQRLSLADSAESNAVHRKAAELDLLINRYYQGFSNIVWKISVRIERNPTMAKDRDFISVLNTDQAIKNIYISYTNKAEAAQRLATVIVRQADTEAASKLAWLHETIGRTVVSLVTLSLVALALGIVLAFVMARMFAKPIIRLRDAAQQVTDGKTAVWVEVTTNDELRELSNSFNTMVTSIEAMIADVQAAKSQSESLLLNILPTSIAERLKSGERVIADVYDNAAILFADIVGFTQLSAQHSAEEIVQMLNWLFSILDRLSEQYGLEKIKTIGDSYMLAGGVPTAREDCLEATADMALDILDRIRDFASQSALPVDVRVGIHTGTVVAGVIGEKKFAYDLWGDTVNTASRMESSGEAGRVHVSETVYLKLKHIPRFAFEERGEIAVKGKGAMRTYFLNRSVATLSGVPLPSSTSLTSCTVEVA